VPLRGWRHIISSTEKVERDDAYQEKETGGDRHQRQFDKARFKKRGRDAMVEITTTKGYGGSREGFKMKSYSGYGRLILYG